jgi:hypothetical protein
MRVSFSYSAELKYAYLSSHEVGAVIKSTKPFPARYHATSKVTIALQHSEALH